MDDMHGWKKLDIELDAPLVDEVMRLGMIDLAEMMSDVMGAGKEAGIITDKREDELLEACSFAAADTCESIFNRVNNDGEFLIVLGQTIANLFLTFVTHYNEEVDMAMLEEDLERLGRN
jgi:hypothetical protein